MTATADQMHETQEADDEPGAVTVESTMGRADA